MGEMSDRGKEQLVKLETEEGEIKRLLLGIMEGYKDTIIPPLSYFSPPNAAEEMGSSSLKRQRDEASMAKTQFKERKRREQMAQKFSVLRSMLPSLCKTYKPSREKIVSDTLNYIKHLEGEIEKLEALKNIPWKEPKLEKPVLMKRPYQNPSKKLRVSNGATFFAIQLPRRRGLLADIVKVFEKHKAEVLEARVCVDDQRLLTFTATIVLGNDGVRAIEKIRQEILSL